MTRHSVPERADMFSSIGAAPEVGNARRSAAGSSFYAAMRVLPKGERQAIFAIYGFCRAVDDIADGPGKPAARLGALEEWRADVNALFDGTAPARVSNLARPVKAYDLRREDFLAIIDGVEMDALVDIVAPDLETLDLYCDRVASAVGRLCVRVFGIDSDDARMLAFHLGRALQLTNILRDLDEDATNGRLYVPSELLREAGINNTGVASILAHPAFDRACSAMANRTRDHFAAANHIMTRHALRNVRAPILMSKVYETILERLLARGFAAPRRPVRVSRRTLLWTVLRYSLLPSRSPV